MLGPGVPEGSFWGLSAGRTTPEGAQSAARGPGEGFVLVRLLWRSQGHQCPLPQTVALMDLAGFNAPHTGGRGVRTCTQVTFTNRCSLWGWGGEVGMIPGGHGAWAWERGFSATCLSTAAGKARGCVDPRWTPRGLS